MNGLTRAAAALLIGIGLSATVASAASAQEVPTGAARIIEKVETRIFISKASLGFYIDAVLANQPALPGGE